MRKRIFTWAAAAAVLAGACGIASSSAENSVAGPHAGAPAGVRVVSPDTSAGRSAAESTDSILLQTDADTIAWAKDAVSQDAAKAADAIARLRAKGQAGLDALLAFHRAEIDLHHQRVARMGASGNDAAWTRLHDAIDQVAQQRDAYVSGLYWYTSQEEAQAAAQAAHKPILSLRMLGKLVDEYSCANSRFFRTTLYANTQVAAYLRDHFILHWESVRPVPVITIDMGDGRILKRTVTGNSIHYILDSTGRVIDGIPGLYGPAAFLKALKAEDDAIAAGADRRGFSSLKMFHLKRAKEIADAYAADLKAVGLDASSERPKGNDTQNFVAITEGAPDAATAMRAAMSKGHVELPLVTQVIVRSATKDQILSDETWSKIAALHMDDMRLDDSTRALMVDKNPNALAAGRLALSKMKVENPMVALVANFERSAAEDTVRNEYLFHYQIQLWLANGAPPVKDFNEQVYAKLFLTPSNDPWLGLAPRDTFTALDDEGLCSK